jgi:hypothetical protein
MITQHDGAKATVSCSDDGGARCTCGCGSSLAKRASIEDNGAIGERSGRAIIVDCEKCPTGLLPCSQPKECWGAQHVFRAMAVRSASLPTLPDVAEG